MGWGYHTLWDYMIICFMTGEGCEGDDDSGGDNKNGGDSGDARGSTGGEGGGVSRFSRSDSEEKRGGDSEVGVGAKASSAVSSICTSPSAVSRGNSSSNKVDAGGHITRLGRCTRNRSWSWRTFCRNIQTRRQVKSNRRFNERRRRRLPPSSESAAIDGGSNSSRAPVKKKDGAD
jgi:hypothetical protein